MSKPIHLTQEQLYDKVYGGWLGKNIGGTLGVPVEGRKELMDMTFYPVLPDEPLENDDLDLQLVWLHALEQYGARLTSKELGQEWIEHIFFPFDEYGYALANLRRGLQPPVAGWFNNPFNDCMGSPIRSEIWAMAAPGVPGVAAYYAYQDAIVDHAGGEGVYGEMFFAAIESQAFVDGDRDRLIRLGLSYIPDDCRTARAIRDLLQWHGEGKDWKTARELILQHHGRPNFTDAPQNIAFTILGWLYGENFGDAILKAVNCGYDTDCTGATLGAILGIIGGRGNLPEEWVRPVGDRVVVSAPIRGFRAPIDLDELTKRTLAVGEEIAAIWLNREKPVFADYAIEPTTNRYLLPQGSSEAYGLQLDIDYGEAGPSIAVSESKRIRFTLTNRSEDSWKGELELEVPADWTATVPDSFEVPVGGAFVWDTEVTAGGTIHSEYRLSLNIRRWHDRAVWSTEEVRFHLVPSCRWRVAGPDGGEAKEVSFVGNSLNLTGAVGTDEPGSYRASSKVVVPSDRDMRLIVATSSPVTVAWNGMIILDDAAYAEFMPAFHRAPQKRCAAVTVTAGEHELEVTVHKGEEPFRLIVAAVAPGQTDRPGNFYYYTDVLFQ